MKRMVTLIEHRYASKTWMPGDEFDCEDSDYELMKALGRAKPTEPKPKVSKVEPPKVHVEPEAEVEEDRSRRRYTRRDMRPQE